MKAASWTAFWCVVDLSSHKWVPKWDLTKSLCGCGFRESEGYPFSPILVISLKLIILWYLFNLTLVHNEFSYFPYESITFIKLIFRSIHFVLFLSATECKPGFAGSPPTGNCTLCPPDWFSLGNQVSCSQCPDGSTTSGATGVTNIAGCSK